jgi:hypothetical protein
LHGYNNSEDAKQDLTITGKTTSPLCKSHVWSFC